MKCNLSSVFNLYQALKRKEKKYFMKVISFPGALAKGFIFLLFQRKKHIAPNITTIRLLVLKPNRWTFIVLFARTSQKPTSY